jgi:crotonobetainyl-CoA:carnitine CoA-transferase CaiB-like acyl-CoA transferase
VGASQGLPLAGVRVVDMSTSFAGPTATMYLADLGADVIKVERPGGDDARTWGPPFLDDESAWFAAANRNKRSLVLNLRQAESTEVLHRLIATAQVFVENVNPQKLVRMGLDPDALCRRHPELVYCAFSGFGLTGPDAPLPGYDLIAQARSGMMSVTGAAGGSPQRVSAPVSDVVTGLCATVAILAALRRVEGGGGGGLVDVALLDADLALMAPRIASYLAGAPEPEPSGGTDSVLSIYQSFETADRPIVLAVGNEAIWDRLCRVLGLADLAADPGLKSNAGRRERRTELVGRIGAVLATRGSAHWLSLLAAASIPAARIASLSEVTADPHVRERGSIFPLPGDDARPATGNQVVAAPWRISSAPPPRRPAPALGGDSLSVLAEIGLDQDQIAGLLASGTVTAHE